MKFLNKKGKCSRLLCILLTLTMLTSAMLPGLTAAAATTPTSLGLSSHGIKAHRDGWKYVYGAKGQTNGSGTRTSDCAGLLYAYFSDCGAIGDMKGGATAQVTYNCVFSNDISEGIPNIHGLALTMPDFNDPGTGIYGHIGIYIGNNEAADNSDTQYNMRRETVVGNSRNWTAWHVMDNGMKYPVNGWYAMDGKMVYYRQYEYVTNTVVDGIRIGSDGFALAGDGTSYMAVNGSMLSASYASASQVASYLRSRYSGVDSTYSLIYGTSGGDDTDTPTVTYNGKVTASSVNLRSEATTQSSVVTVLMKNAKLDLWETVTGETVTHNGKKSNQWYAVTTPGGSTGYICSLFVEKTGALSGTAPTITAADGYVTITANGAADIFYTIDETPATNSSIPYTTPVYQTGYTYRAVAYSHGRTSSEAIATVLSNNAVFTDFVRSSWFYSAIESAVEYGIFSGRGNGKFEPNANITRAEFVMALANLAGADLSGYTSGSPFSDVQSYSNTMHRAILWAYENGYVSGFQDGTFRPSEVICREQMCVILANYAKIIPNEDSEGFADDSSISGWAKNAVYACRDHGLISGVGSNRFDPKSTATRSQACVVTVGLYEQIADGSLAPPANVETGGGDIIEFEPEG